MVSEEGKVKVAHKNGYLTVQHKDKGGFCVDLSVLSKKQLQELINSLQYEHNNRID